MSSAGRCIARSTSSGMVVGPGIARNSRPARTVIVVFLVANAGGRDAEDNERFRLEHDDNRLNASLRAQRSNPALQWVGVATTKTVVARLDRAIQYAVASRLYRWRL